MLSRITSDYNGKTVKTTSAAVLELSFYSKKNATLPNIEMIIIEEEGRDTSYLLVSAYKLAVRLSTVQLSMLPRKVYVGL